MDFSQIDINTPYVKPYSTQFTDMTRWDNPWPFVPYLSNSYNNLVKEPAFPYYDRPLTMGGVLIQNNYDKLNIVRVVYAYWDWLGAVGGVT